MLHLCRRHRHLRLLDNTIEVLVEGGGDLVLGAVRALEGGELRWTTEKKAVGLGLGLEQLIVVELLCFEGTVWIVIVATEVTFAFD